MEFVGLCRLPSVTFVVRSMTSFSHKTRQLFRRFRFYPAVLLSFFICPRASGDNPTPPVPDHSWAPPKLDKYEQDLAHTNFYDKSIPPAGIDTNRVYDLPALIDIAERNNPQTRVSWEQARQAARAVGLSESTYYPQLAAEAAAGFQHQLAALNTVFPGNAAQESATLDLKWLLFDFGGRRASMLAAKEELMVATVGFNATHQQIVFAVTKSFYDYSTARQKVGVAETALQTAQTVGEAAQARFDNGLATKPDVLQAEQETAGAEYDLVAAKGALSDALVALFSSMGILPTADLKVAAVTEKQFEENPEEPLNDLIDRALRQRPDLVAQLAELRAAQQNVRKARSEYYPKVSFEASGGYSKLDVNAYNSSYVGNSKPGYGVGLSIDLPIFEGFARQNQLRIAQSQLRAAESQMADSRDTAVRQVWKAYTDLTTALRKQQSAVKLLEAAQSAYDASLDAYRHGLGTYVDVANAQRFLTSAQSTIVDTRSDIFTSTASLALTVGDLAKPMNSTQQP